MKTSPFESLRPLSPHASGKTSYIGVFHTQEEAARAVDAAIRRAGLEGQRNTNSVDANGPLVPKYSAAHYSAAQP